VSGETPPAPRVEVRECAEEVIDWALGWVGATTDDGEERLLLESCDGWGGSDGDLVELRSESRFVVGLLEGGLLRFLASGVRP